MKKLFIKYEVKSDCGSYSRSYEVTVPYVVYFNSLTKGLEDVIELFELRQEKYRQQYIKEYDKDPFEEKE